MKNRGCFVRSEQNSWNRNTTERITLIHPVFKSIYHELDVKKKAVTQLIWSSMDYFLQLTGSPSLILSELQALAAKWSTLSIPGCCEEKFKPIIICDVDGVLQICLWYDIPALIHSTKSRGKALYFLLQEKLCTLCTSVRSYRVIRNLESFTGMY